MHWHRRSFKDAFIASFAFICMALVSALALHYAAPHSAEAAGETIEGTAHIERIKWSKDPTQFEVRMPDGQILVGSCLDSELPAPKDGDYDFIAVRNSEGSYDVELKTQYTTMNIDDLHEWSIPAVQADPPYTTQRVGGFQWDGGTGRIKLAKKSAAPEITTGNDSYSLKGAEYGIYEDAGCSKLLGSLSTDSEGEAEIELAPGSYYLKETRPSQGYLLNSEVIEVHVAGGRESEVVSQEAPRVYEAGIVLRKLDAELSEYDSKPKTPQGDASLANAVFEVSFFSSDDPEAEPERTWSLKTDDEGVLSLDAEHFISGDDLYVQDGRPVLPFGRIVVRETQAPRGYLLMDGSIEMRLEEGASAELMLEAIDVAEKIMRGSLAIQKLDQELGDARALGQAQLSGAVFEVVSDNEHPVVVQGKTIEKGQLALELTTDADGKAASPDAALPYGSYIVREKSAPTGYLVNDAFEERVEIREHHGMLAVPAARDQVIRGDLCFVKRSAEEQRLMPGVAFRLRSETTGESHVIVTDENGFASTAASHVPHSCKTNGCDGIEGMQAATEASADDKENQANKEADQAKDEANESAQGVSEQEPRSCGIWFSGMQDHESKANDDLGALPYDSYTLEELRCPANEGKELVVQEHIAIRSHSKTIDLGTIENKDMSRKARIETNARDASDGDKELEAADKACIIDEIAYDGLESGKDYRIEGRLMDKGGKPVLANDREIESSTQFKAQSEQGRVELAFELDASALEGRNIVVFERIYDGDELIASHEDIDSVEQSVTIREKNEKEDEEPKGFAKTGNLLFEHRGMIALALGGAAALILALLLARRNEGGRHGAKSSYRW